MCSSDLFPSHDNINTGRKRFLGFITENLAQGDTATVYVSGVIDKGALSPGNNNKAVKLDSTLGMLTTELAGNTSTLFPVANIISSTKMLISKQTSATTLLGQYQ